MANYYLKAELLEKKEQIKFFFTTQDQSISFYNTQIKRIDPIDNEKIDQTYFSDTIVFNYVTRSFQLNKKLLFYMQHDAQFYQVSIIKPQSFVDIYVMIVSLSLLVLVVLLFFILFIVNRQSVKDALKVFYSTINQLKGFNLDDTLNLDQEAEIDEFRQLNRALCMMSDRIKQDFLDLKQYSENTSHELQTPLAILNAKLEELLQSDNLRDEQLIVISNLISTVDRLSNINKALIFLTKIENRIYEDKEHISVNNLIKNHIEIYNDLIEDRQISLVINEKHNLTIHANRLLLETLVNNLIGNSIKHNNDYGSLMIEIETSALIIKNTGKELNVPTQQLFKRFEKGNSGAKSLGIGLSIVQKICEISQFKIDYTNEKEWHIVKVTF